MFQEISGIFSTSNVSFLLTFCRVEVLTSSSFFVLLRPKRNPVFHDLNSPNSKSSGVFLQQVGKQTNASFPFKTLSYSAFWDHLYSVRSCDDNNLHFGKKQREALSYWQGDQGHRQFQKLPKILPKTQKFTREI